MVSNLNILPHYFIVLFIYKTIYKTMYSFIFALLHLCTFALCQKSNYQHITPKKQPGVFQKIELLNIIYHIPNSEQSTKKSNLQTSTQNPFIFLSKKRLFTSHLSNI
jgi:hypothetical protein